MNKEERYQKLRDVVKHYLPEDVPVENIALESHFINELNINSANLVDIVLDIEDTFDILLENDDVAQMRTFSDALNIIDAKLSAKTDPKSNT